jgi:hypothetical protein
MMGRAGVPPKLTEAGDADSAPARLSGIADGQDDAGLSALASSDRESVPKQRAPGDLRQCRVVVRERTPCSSPPVRVKEINSDPGDPARLKVRAVTKPVLPGDPAVPGDAQSGDPPGGPW